MFLDGTDCYCLCLDWDLFLVVADYYCIVVQTRILFLDVMDCYCVSVWTGYTLRCISLLLHDNCLDCEMQLTAFTNLFEL